MVQLTFNGPPRARNFIEGNEGYGEGLRERFLPEAACRGRQSAKFGHRLVAAQDTGVAEAGAGFAPLADASPGCGCAEWRRRAGATGTF